MWFGKLGSSDVEVYVSNGKVYNKDTELGSITDDATTIFEFNKVLYFLNGHEYKKWNGTTFEAVSGYIPLVKIATTPAGVGTDFEPINVLTGKKHQTFSADGTSTDFYLAETNVTSIDKVYVGGVETSVTKDTTNGKVTFSPAPTQGVDNVDIYWTKGTGTASNVTANYYATKYGMSSDTRVFLYGNKTAKNRIYFSDLANGVPNVEYFPGTNFIDIGSSNEFVTDISRQYDRIIISKESETFYAMYDQIVDAEGNSIITFPVFPLNSSHGMVAKGQGQLLDNYVTTIDSSIVQWVNTQSRDERNAEIVSQRVQEWLNDKDLTKAVTMDFQELKEYWLAVGTEILIYNYGNSTFYLLSLPEKPTCFFMYDGDIYMGTYEGSVVKWGYNDTTFDGETIDAEWQSGFYDFDMEYKRKTMRRLWIALKPWVRTSIVVNYVSDRNAGTDPKEVSAITYAYGYVNYTDWTYNTSYNVKPFRIKLKAKKFAFEKIILTNNKRDEKLTVNSIEIQKSYGGDVK